MANFGVVSIRKELACKQIELAAFLNIPRQLLAHAEKNSRSLDMEQLKLISKLHELLSERKKTDWKSPEISKLLAREKSTVDEKLPDQLAETRHLWQKHRLELDKMQAEYNDRINALHQLHFLKSQVDVWSESQIKWLDHTISTHQKKLTNYNLDMQRKLECQIVMCAAQIETLNKLIGNKFDILLETLNFFDGMQTPTNGIKDDQK